MAPNQSGFRAHLFHLSAGQPWKGHFTSLTSIFQRSRLSSGDNNPTTTAIVRIKGAHGHKATGVLTTFKMPSPSAPQQQIKPPRKTPSQTHTPLFYYRSRLPLERGEQDLRKISLNLSFLPQQTERVNLPQRRECQASQNHEAICPLAGTQQAICPGQFPFLPSLSPKVRRKAAFHSPTLFIHWDFTHS